MGRGRREKAFSLVELLTVVVIIGLLVAMIFPAYRAVSDRVKLVMCQSNLKACHRILVAYAELNNGFFPEFHPYYGGSVFHPAKTREPYDRTMSDALLLKQLGGTANMWFCPMDPFYGRQTWAWKTWSTRQYTLSIGYTAMMSRRVQLPDGTWEPAPLADGRRAPVRADCDDNEPLMADLLRYRNDGHGYGWYHGGGWLYAGDDGLFNSSANTLTRGGAVIYTTWQELESQGPGLAMGPLQNDQWWFWLGSDVPQG